MARGGFLSRCPFRGIRRTRSGIVTGWSILRIVARQGRTRPSARASSGAEALVAQLEALGVEVVFGIPGVHNLAIFDALRRSPIRTILVRHEQTAAYAADGYARATGRLGVCVTTTGPGAANTAAAMGEARASRSPVLQVSTQVESRVLEGRSGRWSLHESPHQREMMDAVSVWSGTVARTEAIPTMVLSAATAAFSGRRGPVFLDVPHDFLDAPVRWKPQAPLKDRLLPPEPEALARAAEALRGAKRPVIWAGGGAVAADAGAVLAKVAEVLDAPVVTSYAGKGILPPDHPLCVGFPPHQPEVADLISSAGAVLVVGSDLDGMSTQGWRMRFPRLRVSINTVAEDARRNYASDVIVEADARAALEALLPLLSARAAGDVAARRAPASRRPVAGDAAARVAAVRRAAGVALRAHADFKAPYRFVQRVAAAVPPDAVVLADMAVAGYWLAGYYQPPRARAFAYPVGWGTLGFALPAAVGAAASGCRALVVTGDAGLLYAPGELATLVQDKLPVTVLVVNDGGYGMLRFDEAERFGDTFAADLRSPDFVAMARSFGMSAERTTHAGLEDTLRRALATKKPALVELRARFAPPLTTSPRWPLKGRKEARP